MSKQTAKTLQMRLGFLDEDLKKPEHDEIIKWMDKNIHSIVSELFIKPDWTQDEIKSIEAKAEKLIKDESLLFRIKRTVDDLDQELRRETQDEKRKEISKRKAQAESIIDQIVNWKGIKGEIPKKKQIRIIDKIWEYPISSTTYNDRTGYKSPKNIVGYVDMKVTFIYNRLTVNGFDFEGKSVYSSDFSWGQTDLRYDTWGDREYLTHSVYFEAKTKITSLGELFRQLRTYKEFENGHYVIVCPDDTEKKTIIGQGFQFYKCP